MITPPHRFQAPEEFEGDRTWWRSRRMFCPGRHACLHVALLFRLLHGWRAVLGLLLFGDRVIGLVRHSPL